MGVKQFLMVSKGLTHIHDVQPTPTKLGFLFCSVGVPLSSS